MSAIERRVESATRPKSDDDLEHTVCCVDSDVSLCGLDVSHLPWGGDDEECVVCERMDGADLCPYFGICVSAQIDDPGASR